MRFRHALTASTAAVALVLTGSVASVSIANASPAEERAIVASGATGSTLQSTDATVTGLLQAPDGTPSRGYVELLGYTDEGSDEWIDSVEVGEDGAFGIVVPAGWSTYTITASSSSFQRTWLGDTPDEESATRFTWDEAHDFDATIRFVESAYVAGEVTADGLPLDVGYVAFLRWSGTRWTEQVEVRVGAGHYFSDDLPVGTYTLVYRAHRQGPALQVYGGGTELVAPTATNSVELSAGEQTIDLDIHGLATLEGTVLGNLGPLGDAEVTLYQWDDEDEDWASASRTATTTSDGAYAFPGVPAGTYTVRVVRSRFAVGFLGGGAAFSVPSATNSVTVTAETQRATLPAVTLAPRVSALGRHAGLTAPYCSTHSLLPNDDESTEAVTLPFSLTFFGQPYSELYVNNNGNVTFDGPLSQYTPDALDGAQAKPIIAPFFADVDTRDTEESDVVTYGASPDGRSFCVTWANVEPYRGTSSVGLVNTFQLVLTSREGVPGRTAGDFDVTFNYDEITWDTGSASDVAATAGFASGTGAPGTYVQLDGALTDGAFLDGGPSSLVDGRQSSDRQGRYTYEIRNAGHAAELGGVAGTVESGPGVPAAGAVVEISNGRTVYTTRTLPDGSYTFSAVRAGDYTVRVWPVTDGVRQIGARTTVVAGETAQVDPLQFAPPATLPANVGLSGPTSGTAAVGTVPSVHYQEPLTLTYGGAPGLAVRYEILAVDGTILTSGTFAEVSAGSYAATVQRLYPAVGDALVRITVVGGAVAPVEFAIYIDPSGTVVDSWGMPVAGATTTLLRADTYDGTYVAVPNGSTLMSADNRTNPMATSAQGVFGWDVQAGWYKLRVEKAGYTTLETAALQVPPERVDLVLRMTGGAAPQLASGTQGSGASGSTLTLTPPTLPAGFSVVGYRWLRNGTAIAGATSASYLLTDADAGTVVTGVAVVQRAPVRFDPLDASNLVEFASFESAASGVTVAALPVVTPGPSVTSPTIAKGKVSVTGRPRVGAVLTAKRSGFSGATAYKVQWLRNGKAIPGATRATYRAAGADLGKRLSVRVTASRAGAVAVAATSTSTAKVARGGGRMKVTARSAKKRVVTLKVSVARDGIVTTRLGGKVTVREGRKTIGTYRVTKGRATITVGKLRPGTHTLTIAYPRSTTHAALTAKVKVRVR